MAPRSAGFSALGAATVSDDVSPITVSAVVGADAVNLYDLYPAVLINGSAAPGRMILASFVGVLFVPAIFAGIELLMTRRRRAPVPAE